MKSEDWVLIRVEGVIHRIVLNDIRYIESQGNLCTINAIKTHVIRSSLVNIEMKLPNGWFIRIHKRYIVNSRKIEKLNLNKNIVHITDMVIPIGPAYKKTLLLILKDLII